MEVFEAFPAKRQSQRNTTFLGKSETCITIRDLIILSTILFNFPLLPVQNASRIVRVDYHNCNQVVTQTATAISNMVSFLTQIKASPST